MRCSLNSAESTAPCLNGAGGVAYAGGGQRVNAMNVLRIVIAAGFLLAAFWHIAFWCFALWDFVRVSSGRRSLLDGTDDPPSTAADPPSVAAVEPVDQEFEYSGKYADFGGFDWRHGTWHYGAAYRWPVNRTASRPRLVGPDPANFRDPGPDFYDDGDGG